MKEKIVLLFLADCLIFTIMNAQDPEQKIEYRPIGFFHSPLTPQTGAPRQGILASDIEGKIEIYDEYQKALESLEMFEYIIVLYHFDKIRGWKDIVVPPGSNRDHNFGLFATRSPSRPNPIGFAIIKLERIENNILYISGIDAFDGTPVLDIKPYLPSIDCVKSKRNESVEKDLGLMNHDNVNE